MDPAEPRTLIGKRISFLQEDDTTTEAIVTDYNSETRQHHVIAYPGTAEETTDWLPLEENPESYTVIGVEPGFGSPQPLLLAGPPAVPHAVVSPPPPAATFQPPAPKVPKRKQPQQPAARPHSAGKADLVPYPEAVLKDKLATADTRELGHMLAAISKKEQATMAELDQHAPTMDQELRDSLRNSITQRADMVTQLLAAAH